MTDTAPASRNPDTFVQNRSRRLIVPEVGSAITVTLPGEIIRAEVVRVVDNDHIVCKIAQPMAKSHSFIKGQEISFHRARGMVNEHWEAG